MSGKIKATHVLLVLTKPSGSNDIPGFQNRLGISFGCIRLDLIFFPSLGVFFFTLALFGFSCLSSLGLFANERLLFMRERANGYYSSFTYFSSKVSKLPLWRMPSLLKNIYFVFRRFSLTYCLCVLSRHWYSVASYMDWLGWYPPSLHSGNSSSPLFSSIW